MFPNTSNIFVPGSAYNGFKFLPLLKRHKLLLYDVILIQYALKRWDIVPPSVNEKSLNKKCVCQYVSLTLSLYMYVYSRARVHTFIYKRYDFHSVIIRFDNSLRGVTI